MDFTNPIDRAWSQTLVLILTAELILAAEVFRTQQKEYSSSVKSGCIFYLKLIVMIMVLMIVKIMMTIWHRLFFVSLFPHFKSRFRI